MNNVSFDDQPARFPAAQVNGSPLKTITHVLLDRRATAHFKPDAVPQEYLDGILRFAAQAPSGYNLQPWRFIVVREPDNRRRLQKAAMDQSKVGEAPVVVIAYAGKGEWEAHMDAIFREGVRRGTGKADKVESAIKTATGFVETLPEALWLNRHVMIAVTTMMLVAEAYGLDTAPMEGFDPAAVKREFGLPQEAEVVALLAIGFAAEPDKAYGGRLALREIVHVEHYGRPWPGNVVA
ncbi:MAG TPA: nitroreductase family protein [Verrucomicrobiae bacterium]|nr:nitroreductase family protein [Verrucomicrobiae bacterium]